MKSPVFGIIVFFSFVLFTSCTEDDDMLSWDNPDSLYFSKIWDNNRHCAFTDLIEFHGYYYCCFRESTKHIPSSSLDYGKIRVLRSVDGNNWYSVECIESKDYDLRDPKFSITPDDELMLLYGNSILDENNTLSYKKMQVTFFSNINEAEFIKATRKEDISIDKWLWRIVWNRDTAYGISYLKGRSSLIEYTNTASYKTILDFDPSIDISEADLFFDENNTLYVVARSYSSNGYIGQSQPPYTTWKWTRSNQLIHSPKIIAINNKLFVTGRGSVGGNIIFYIDQENLTLRPIYILPGGGDTGYPGAIIVNNELWISYYSSYHNSCQIYLAKISVEALMKKVY